MTASGVEILWSFINLVGLIAALALVDITWQKRRAAVKESALVRRAHLLTANRYLRNDLKRVFYHGMGLLVGLVEMTRLSRVSDQPTNYWAVTILMLMTVLMTASSIWDLLDERELSSAVRKTTMTTNSRQEG